MLKKNIYENTSSIWDWLGNNWEDFQNPFYQGNVSETLIINASIKNLRVWKEHFFHFYRTENRDFKSEKMSMLLKEEKLKNLKLENEIKELEKKLKTKDKVMKNIRESLNKKTKSDDQ